MGGRYPRGKQQCTHERARATSRNSAPCPEASESCSLAEHRSRVPHVKLGELEKLESAPVCVKPKATGSRLYWTDSPNQSPMRYASIRMLRPSRTGCTTQTPRASPPLTALRQQQERCDSSTDYRIVSERSKLWFGQFTVVFCIVGVLRKDPNRNIHTPSHVIQLQCGVSESK